MLISRVVEDNGVSDIGGGGEGHLTDDSLEFQTANELFELFSPNIDQKDLDGLSQRDVVLLYKNLEVSSHINSNSDEVLRNPTNEYVESIIYKDDDNEESSELFQICSSDDFSNVFDINNERIDLFNNTSSGNKLCNKFGNTQLQSSIMTSEYSMPFFLGPINNQDSLSRLTGIDDLQVLPNTLTDYISCKQMEDTYDFCLDNVIHYVQHTIDHLKKISNGEFLTDKVKEKWLETTVNNNEQMDHVDHRPSSLVVQSISQCPTVKWDNQFKADQSPTKVLKRNMAPILFNGTFNKLTKYFAANIVFGSDSAVSEIAKKRPISPLKDYKVELIFDVKRSGSRFLNGIGSLMFPSNWPRVQISVSLQVINQTISNTNAVKNTVVYTEIGPSTSYDDNVSISDENTGNKEVAENTYRDETIPQLSRSIDSISRALEVYTKNVKIDDFLTVYPDETDLEHNSLLLEFFDYTDENSDYPHTEMNCFTVQQLTQQLPLEEDDAFAKKRGHQVVRIKSPYENKSLVFEERKRNKILEIREKKKLALEGSGKIQKNKYDKGFVKSQPSNSVTALSITNKAFYDSIYGHHPGQRRYKKLKRPLTSITVTKTSSKGSIDDTDFSSLCTELNDNKYINRSFFLDEIETGIMQTPNAETKEKQSFVPSCSTAMESGAGVESHDPIKESSLNVHEVQENFTPFICSSQNITLNIDTPSDWQSSLSNIGNCFHDEVYDNETHVDEIPEEHNPLGFIESIDKIYGILKKFDPVKYSDAGEIKLKQSKEFSKNIEYVKTTSRDGDEVVINPKARKESPDQTFPAEKADRVTKKSSLRNEAKSKNKAGVNFDNPPTFGDVMENKPVRTISQLIQEIDKMKKRTNKIEKSDMRQNPRQPKRGNARFDVIQEREVVTTPNRNKLKPKLPLPLQPKTIEKQIFYRRGQEITDEQKEARGEAVRGPSTISRIDALAKPRRFHGTMHKDEPHRIQRINYDKQNRKPLPEKKTAKKNKPAPLINKPSETTLKTLHKDKSDVTLTLFATNHHQMPSPQPNVMRQRSPVSAAPAAAAGQPTASAHRLTRKPSTTSTPPVLHNSSEKYPTDILYLNKVIEAKSRAKSPKDNSSLSRTKLNKTMIMPMSTTSVTEIAGSTHSNEENLPNLMNKIHVTYRHVLQTGQPKTNFDYRTKRPSENLRFKTEVLEEEETLDESSEETVVSHRQKSSGDYHVPVKVSIALTPKNSLQHLVALHSGDTASIQLPSNDNEKPELNNLSSLIQPIFNFTQSVLPMQISTISYALTNSPVTVQVAQIGTSTSSIKSNTNILTNKTTQFNASIYSFLSSTKLFSDRMITYPSDKTIMNVKEDVLNAAKDIATSKKNVCCAHESLIEKDKTCIISKSEIVKNSHLDIRDTHESFIQKDEICMISETEIVKNSHLDINCTHDSLIQKDETCMISDSEIVKNSHLDINCNHECLIQKDETCMISDSEIVKNSHLDINCNHECLIQKEETCMISESEIVKNSHSLDILVGLLDEIHNITTCQTKITNPLMKGSENLELETIFQENPYKSRTAIISMPSYDRLGQIGSNASIYSLYMSNNRNFFEKETNKSSVKLQSESIQTLKTFEDKAVGNDIKHLVNRFSNVQSVFSIKNVSVQVLDEKSTSSLYTYFEYQPNYTAKSICGRGSFNFKKKTMIETGKSLRKIKNNNINSCTTILYQHNNDYINHEDSPVVDISVQTVAEPLIAADKSTMVSFDECSKHIVTYEIDKEPTKDNRESNDLKDEKPLVVEKAKRKKIKMKTEGTKFSPVTEVKSLDKTVRLDPTMHMKRDILVAVYSVLVVTVFAALSFPGLV